MDGWCRFYPPAVFPTLWERMDELVTGGALRMSEEAYRETQRKHDDLSAWVKQRKRQIVIPTCEQVQYWVGKIMADPYCSQLVDINRDRSGADPFVIAAAKAHGLFVVTGEVFDPLRKKPKIPNVCARFQVPVCSFLEMLRRESLKF
jgi:hypothetical protein